MAEYIVVRPWFGVKKGQRITINGKPHHAIKSNIRLMSEEIDEEQEDLNETPNPGAVDPLGLADNLGNGASDEFDWESVRTDVISELDDAAIAYEADAPAAELAALLDEEVREGIKLGAQ